jgi:hypothetical protein
MYLYVCMHARVCVCVCVCVCVVLATVVGVLVPDPMPDHPCLRRVTF